MEDKPDIVRIKLDQDHRRPETYAATRALQLKLGNNKTVIVYNHIQGYILDALMKAVFNDAH
ncbi:hypothetical protein FND55_01085 [Lactobacillus paracasei subsp. paracasei]|uniref:hypothetical protein n=1 Tax=Lacticaseibacillus paracasei TaxID=1597 RepID=UPI0018C616D7|nr:hypothetical protein [Lacticaseibacillus paracasei]MBG1272260.1 hypothetical protein [Lacticaseibacillus paracasei subsp. paracasei]MEA0974304.1 hypothetical protein [Lacticaseibacillus paracasei]UZD27684.1 hypothetical protein OKX02_15555 [Lacticaseibacillus paracasei]